MKIFDLVYCLCHIFFNLYTLTQIQLFVSVNKAIGQFNFLYDLILKEEKENSLFVSCDAK